MKPHIKKIGTIDCDVVETTPIVFREKLYRFEYIRKRYHDNNTGNSYFQFIDIESHKKMSPFGKGYHLGSAFVNNDTIYVFAVEQWGSHEMRTFFSKDMLKWESYSNIIIPGFAIYNNSVCENGEGKFIMLIELGKPLEEIGVPFTPRFLQSDDLLNWDLLPIKYIFGKDVYTGGHFLLFENGYYYLTYVHLLSGQAYDTHIVRSKDLINWKSSPLNPFMTFSEEDKVIANQNLSKIQRDRILKAENINCSDHEFCEFRGKTIINYCWGNQLGTEFLAEAIYENTVKNLLEGFFPE